MSKWLLTLGFFAALCGLTAAGDAQEKGKGKLQKLDPEAVFKRLDADKDGKVTKDEFKKLGDFGQGKLKERPQLLDRWFASLDADKDDKLTADEFKKFRELVPGAGGQAGVKDPEELFKKLDADKDGKVTKDEFKKGAEELPGGRLASRPELRDKVTDRMFEKLDGNSDKSLSLDEFKKVNDVVKGLLDRKKDDK